MSTSVLQWRMEVTSRGNTTYRSKSWLWLITNPMLRDSAVRLALGRESCRGLWSLRSCHSHLATVPLQLELVWEPSAGSMPHPIPEHSSSSIRDDSSMVTRNITTDVMARALGSLFLGG